MPSPSQSQCLGSVCDTTTASGSGICTWSVFPCLQLHPLRGYSPRGDALPNHPAMDTDRPCCHPLPQGQLPSWASLETHTLLWKDPSPMSFSLQCWKNSGVKKPENGWWEFMKDVPALCSRAGRSKLPLNETTGSAGSFLPQDGAQCRLQSISRKLHKYLKHLNPLAEPAPPVVPPGR